jgi:hypothetical protein
VEPHYFAGTGAGSARLLESYHKLFAAAHNKTGNFECLQYSQNRITVLPLRCAVMTIILDF